MTEGLTRRAALTKSLEAAGAALATGALAAPVAGLAAPAPKRSGQRPNILFIPIDDMNDWTGWQGGYPLASTPHLDRLAGQGTAFLNAYTQAPVCKASRAAALFGLDAWKSGIYTNRCLDWTEIRAFDDRISLPRAFKEAGYLTAYTGKIHHAGWINDGPGNDPRSWVEAHPFRSWAEDSKEAPIWAASGTRNNTQDMKRARFVAETYLSRDLGRPWFVALGIHKPHMKWIMPQEYLDRFPKDMPYPLGALDTLRAALGANEDLDDLPPAGKAMVKQHHADHLRIAGKGEWKQFVRAYNACVSEADDAIGVALNALRTGPNASNTIVVVWSDHGWQLGEKCAWRKLTLWERALRVPVILAGPGVASRKTKALFSTVDLYRTICDLAGVDRPDETGGVSHASFVRGGPSEQRNAVVSAWALDIETGGPELSRKDYRKDLHFRVRTTHKSLIAYGNGDREVYDFRNDPYEWTNLAERKSERDWIERIEADHVPKKPVAPAVGLGGVEKTAVMDE